MTLASDLRDLNRLRDLTALMPEGVQRTQELEEIDQLISERQMNFLAMQSAQMDADAMSGLQQFTTCLLYTSPSPRDGLLSRMPSSA